MIKLEDDQILNRETHLAVKTGGEYEETALVEVYLVGDPEKDAKWAYQAKYIATGESA